MINQHVVIEYIARWIVIIMESMLRYYKVLFIFIYFIMGYLHQGFFNIWSYFFSISTKPNTHLQYTCIQECVLYLTQAAIFQ